MTNLLAQPRQAMELAHACQGAGLKGAWYSRRHGTNRLLPGAGSLARRLRRRDQEGLSKAGLSAPS